MHRRSKFGTGLTVGPSIGKLRRKLTCKEYIEYFWVREVSSFGE